MVKEKTKGFTLIELLVVIAIIALLLSIILPSLKAAKELASGAVCVSNQRQLVLAWTSYSNDNNEMLVGGSNYYRTSIWPYATPYRWVEYPLRTDKDNPETTTPANDPTELSLETRQNGIRAGRLFPYTQDVDLYHCPGDKNFTNAEPDAVFRSYSIAGLMNGEHFENRENNNLYSPIATYSTLANGKELFVAVKTTQIKSPGNKYVFVEEDVSMKNQHVNAGGFVLLYEGNHQWWDWPAYYHNDSSTLGFADGHAERHRWQDTRTLQLMKEGFSATLTRVSASVDNEDLDWMALGYIPKP